jgi:hypothetical protein
MDEGLWFHLRRTQDEPYSAFYRPPVSMHRGRGSGKRFTLPRFVTGSYRDFEGGSGPAGLREISTTGPARQLPLLSTATSSFSEVASASPR